MSTTETGRKAETAARNYLEMRGYEIVEQNWRRPRCEIDIIAKKDGVIYFVEVKYRRNNNQGSGLEYITASKQKQMQFAAFNWVSETKWSGDFRLAAVEVGGPNFAIMSFIDNII
jgi:putative endonuclease